MIRELIEDVKTRIESAGEGFITATLHEGETRRPAPFHVLITYGGTECALEGRMPVARAAVRLTLECPGVDAAALENGMDMADTVISALTAPALERWEIIPLSPNERTRHSYRINLTFKQAQALD